MTTDFPDTVLCLPSENAGEAEISPQQSLPPWRKASIFKTESIVKTMTYSSTCDSPGFSGAKSTSPSEEAAVEDSPISCGRRTGSHASTSTAQSSDEDGSISADEGTVADSGASDDDRTSVEVENDCEESKGDSLEGSRLVMALTQILMYLTAQGGPTQRSTTFHASRAPHLGLSEYLGRISEYFECSDQCYVIALVYMDRVIKTHPDFVLNNLSVHRFLLASMVVASKFQDDAHHANVYYARIGGVSPKSLNHMEQELLHLIDWQLYISSDEYDQYFKLLQLQL